jgi:zinc transport system substrate-binding protein
MKARPLFPIVLILSFILLVAGAACQRQEQQTGRKEQLTIVTTLFPLYDFTKNIVGDKALVTLLIPPGVEAHSFEPKAGDVMKVNTADLFVFTGRFMEPWADNLLKGADNKKIFVVDASKGVALEEGEHEHGSHSHNKREEQQNNGQHNHGKIDPHIWLDLANAQKMVTNIVEALEARDPDNNRR